MRQLLLRFILGATVSLGAAIVTVVLGPLAGGVFLAFPAILPATLTLLERDKGTVAAVGDARGALAGALGLVAFAVTVIILAHHTPAAITLLTALSAWIVASLLLYVIGIGVERLLHAQQYPPEVPVSLVRPLLGLLRARRLTLFVVDGGAGDALGAVLIEAHDDRDVVRGAISAPDVESACELAGVTVVTRSSLTDSAKAVAIAARVRWGGDVAAALLSRRRDHPTRGEDYGLAVATPSGVETHEFVAHRGREGNWGEAVLLSVRFIHSVITGRQDAPRQSRSGRRYKRPPGGSARRTASVVKDDERSTG